jgi:hypothetical protein
MAISRIDGCRVTGLALRILAGCGGGQGASSPGAPTSASVQQAPPSSAGPGSAPPLVDSRGNRVPEAEGAGPQGLAGKELAWTVPPGWVTQVPSSSMRKAQYALPAAPGDSEAGQCAVFYFGPGQGGDVQANVERWATQFSAPAGGHPTPEESQATVSGMKVLKVGMEGTYNSSSMMGGESSPKPGTLLLGAIVEGPDANWFFKCTGPKKTMDSHRKEFDALIDSVHVQ